MAQSCVYTTATQMQKVLESLRDGACSKGTNQCLFISLYHLCTHQQYCRAALTSSETVVPPISLAEICFQIVGGPCNDYNRRRDQCPYAEKHAERQDDDAEPFQQACVGYFHSFRRFHSEDYGYPANEYYLFFYWTRFLIWCYFLN